jgi:predicted nucleic acid-binding protein
MFCRTLGVHLQHRVAELEAGIQQTLKNRKKIGGGWTSYYHVRLWPLDANTARQFGTVYMELRRLGRVLSQVDMMLAALARQHKLTVLITDRDFEALTDLQAENWAL